MNAFPYFAILKKAFVLTIRRPWLWVFGIFISGTFGFNLYSFSLPYAQKYESWQHAFRNLRAWIEYHHQGSAFGLLGGLAVFLILLVASGLARGAVIWSAKKLSEPEAEKKVGEVGFAKSLAVSRRYVWKVVAAQVFVTAIFFALLFLFLTPTLYLFSVGFYGRAILLLLVGLAVFLPSILVLGFIHVYSPIFVVLYDNSLAEALIYAFNLTRRKFWESVLLAAFLVGLNLVFILLMMFSTIFILLPVAILAFLAYVFGLPAAFSLLIFGAILFVLLYVIVWTSAFAAFQNIVWVLAVDYMVKTRKTAEKAEVVPAAEPAT